MRCWNAKDDDVEINARSLLSLSLSLSLFVSHSSKPRNIYKQLRHFSLSSLSLSPLAPFFSFSFSLLFHVWCCRRLNIVIVQLFLSLSLSFVSSSFLYTYTKQGENEREIIYVFISVYKRKKFSSIVAILYKLLLFATRRRTNDDLQH